MKQYIWIGVIGLIYLVLSVTAPITASSQALGLSALQIRLLQATIAVPFMFSWIAGMMGHKEIWKYSQNIKDKDQQIAFRRIATGIKILVLASIATSFVSIIRTRFTSVLPEIVPVATIAINYLYVFPPLIGLWLVFDAGKSLARSVGAPKLSALRTALGLLFPLAFSALNFILTLTNVTRQLIQPGIQASYYLPDILIILTILIPSAITWIFGTLGVLQIQNYREHVKGTIFQSAISRFTLGLFTVVFASIFLQLLLALGSSRLLAFGLAGILIIVYVFVILQTLGYFLIAWGSKKLAQVEQILSKYTDQAAYESRK